MNIPFLDLKAQHRAIKDEILPLWAAILEQGSFIGGEHVEGLEREFAEACGVRYAVAVGSGTDALRLIFIALGLGPGDEVITVPNTFIATTEAITQAGGRPVFVDVRPDTYNMDPEAIEAAISPRTRGIVPVHLYGQPADMDPILRIAARHGLWVVEDAAQAHLAEYRGRKAGSMGTAAAFSFYPGKNLGACGEAGMITTGDAELAAKTRMLRDHGQARKYYHDLEGYNARCDALQAAALRVKLKYLPAWTEARRNHAQLYRRLLGDAAGVVTPAIGAGTNPVWHLFVVQVDGRDEVMEAMNGAGIHCGLHYPIPLHLQKAYAAMEIGAGAFPVAEELSRRALSLPMFPELTDQAISDVCRGLEGAVRMNGVNAR
ncbi:DegT/DnrJ/EryC1/StrS family aminotransferase [bacterium]|nr:DegT/DnrJ/EryC1/StrS family aminotransferase [bacterium]